MHEVLKKLESFKDKPTPGLSAAEARKNHTPADAVMALIKEKNIAIPASKVDTSGSQIAVKDGKIHLRIYTPKEGKAPFPVIVYYHGGGFVIADLNVYHGSAKALAEQCQAIVVSVAYRQGPEHKFPTAHQDAYAAYEWTLKNAAAIEGDPKRIAVAGESAGGNLAANVSIMARERGLAMPVHQLLVYPIASNDLNSNSYKKYAAAKPLNKPMMEWFFKNYMHNMEETKNTMINLVNANLKGLPSTTIVIAEIDPLQSDGYMLMEKLKAAGVAVNTRPFEGVTHEFFGMAPVVPQAVKAQEFAAEEMKKAFKK
jgi:acetyl esterase